jgi:hypothetical protein
MRKLYLDDLRDPKGEGFIVVRSYDDAVKYCIENGCPDEVSLDHDLGMILVGKSIKTGDYEAPSGFDFAKWLVDTDIDLDGFFIPTNFKWNVHSANPTGAANIAGLLKNYLEFRDQDH